MKTLSNQISTNFQKINIYKFSKKKISYFFLKKTFKCDEKFMITSNIFSL
jgi:hypothetical protein